MTYERRERLKKRLDESHRLVEALITTTSDNNDLELRQMYSYIGEHLFTKLGLPAKYLIGPAGQFQDNVAREATWNNCSFVQSRTVTLYFNLRSGFLFKVSSAFEFSSPGIRTSFMLVI